MYIMYNILVLANCKSRGKGEIFPSVSSPQSFAQRRGINERTTTNKKSGEEEKEPNKLYNNVQELC